MQSEMLWWEGARHSIVQPMSKHIQKLFADSRGKHGRSRFGRFPGDQESGVRAQVYLVLVPLLLFSFAMTKSMATQTNISNPAIASAECVSVCTHHIGQNRQGDRSSPPP
jgi:hypothetical protein